MNSETAYLFRHALLREAAYQLQLPGDRARLHDLALAVMEDLFGGRPAEPPPLDISAKRFGPTHPADAMAEEIAEHARLSPGGAVEAERGWVRRAAEHAENTFRLDSAAALWTRLARLLGPPHDADVLAHAGICAWKAGRLAEAEPLFRQAVARFRTAGERLREGIVHSELGGLLHAAGKVAESEASLEKALVLLRATGARIFEGRTLLNLGRLFTRTARTERAESMLREALAISKEFGSRTLEGNVLNSLAGLFDLTGRSMEALALCESALALQRSEGNRRGEGVALSDLGSILHELDRVEESEQAHRQALAIHREVGNRPIEAMTLANIAGLGYHAGRVEEAAGILRTSLALQRENREPRLEASQLCMYAEVLAALDRFEEAGAAWLEGAGLLRLLGDTIELDQWDEQLRSVWAKAGVEFPA